MTNVYIKDWSAWTPNIKDKDNWRLWAHKEDTAEFCDELNISDVPAMLRRRLSNLGKMTIACANDTQQDVEQRPSLFCSRHGELARSIELLKSLANDDLLSPTHFSLSVHNAIGGMLSINKKDPSNITAIAAAENTVGTSLLEAQLILQEQGCKEILCIIYDDPIPAPYTTEINLPLQSYALALVLSSEPSAINLNLSIAASASAGSTDEKPTEPQALTFLRFLLSKDTRLELSNQHTCYQLQKVES